MDKKHFREKSNKLVAPNVTQLNRYTSDIMKCCGDTDVVDRYGSLFVRVPSTSSCLENRPSPAQSHHSPDKNPADNLVNNQVLIASD